VARKEAGTGTDQALAQQTEVADRLVHAATGRQSVFPQRLDIAQEAKGPPPADSR
jgi:hypothetical protein